MALAGPGANLLLVIVAFILIRTGVFAGVLASPNSAGFGRIVESAGGDDGWRGVAFVLSAFFSMNLVLLSLNLIPLPPLDGSGAVPILLSDDTARKYQTFMWSNRAFGLIGLVLAWQFFKYVFDPVFFGAVNLLYPGMRYG